MQAVCLLTNVPFVQTDTSTLAPLAGSQSTAAIEEVNTAASKGTEANNSFNGASEASELTIDTTAYQSPTDECAHLLLFSDLEIQPSSPAPPTTPSYHRAPSTVLSRRLRQRCAPLVNAPSNEINYEGEIAASTQFFVPISEGTGLGHIFVSSYESFNQESLSDHHNTDFR